MALGHRARRHSLEVHCHRGCCRATGLVWQTGPHLAPLGTSLAPYHRPPSASWHRWPVNNNKHSLATLQEHVTMESRCCMQTLPQKEAPVQPIWQTPFSRSDHHLQNEPSEIYQYYIYISADPCRQLGEPVRGGLASNNGRKGSESNVRQWGPWPAGPVRPSGPCCFGVAKAPFVSLRGWKTDSSES